MYKLTMRLAEALVDEIQRNEILQLKGDSAALVIECLDKVGTSTLHPMPALITF